ncbi:hypothetical protein [Jannaschia sp. LMIT008]|uniref:hypothetical protein n=1 Tax=Jannaschia maritima TaxID=3032585 RepID=UPI0028125F2B|nr:hypothetical protein [Jannaschia sp. LMIT008]
MTLRTITLAAVAAAVPMAASAISVTQTFQGSTGADATAARAAFNAAFGSVSQVEDFSGFANGTLLDNTMFPTTGTQVSPNAPSADNAIVEDVLFLSVDNTGSATNPANPLTQSVTITLPNATTFFGADFGASEDGFIGTNGIGNDSGLTIALDGTVVETFTLSDPGFTGFFGLQADMAFTTITFGSAAIGGFTDDDFALDNLQFSDGAVIPVPAALPLLAAGLGLMGWVGARRRG